MTDLELAQQEIRRLRGVVRALEQEQKQAIYTLQCIKNEMRDGPPELLDPEEIEQLINNTLDQIS